MDGNLGQVAEDRKSHDEGNSMKPEDCPKCHWHIILKLAGNMWRCIHCLHEFPWEKEET